MCKDKVYNNYRGLILADCLEVEQIMDYNKRNGDFYYISPLTQIFCVRFNNAPLMGDYWVQKTALENSDIEGFELSAFR